jgi:hypothetical protein
MGATARPRTAVGYALCDVPDIAFYIWNARVGVPHRVVVQGRLSGTFGGNPRYGEYRRKPCS